MAQKKLDLIGQRFGRLIVVEECPERTKHLNTQWVCKCDCGKIVIKVGAELNMGRVRSCGCLQKELLTLKLVGQRFGRLTVIEKHPEKYRRNIRWVCKCDCGNTVVANGAALKSGHSKSCGCYNIDMIIKRNYKHGMSYTKEYQNTKASKRRAIKLNQSPQLTKEEQHSVETLYRWAQELPGDWHVDHVQPLSKEGLHHPDNLQVIPAHQNQQKSNKTPQEFYGRHYDFMVNGILP